MKRLSLILKTCRYLCIIISFLCFELFAEAHPVISVLMPVYNTKESWLREAIESILNQSFKSFELLIVDDGSTTDIESIVKSYNDPRIKFYKNERNLGISISTNRLMDLANGKYLALMDSDDISLPDRLAKEFEYLEMHPDVSVVSCWCYWNFEKSGKRALHNPKQILTPVDFCIHDEVPNSGAMMRKSDIEKHKIRYKKDMPPCQDYDFWARASLVMKIHILQEVLFIYRIHSDSFLKKNQELRNANDKRIQEYMLNKISGLDKAIYYVRYFFKYILSLNV